MKQKANKFSGQIGFILAAAGSAVGVGNLWRFPYLAAKYGSLFVIVYLILVVTFGFALLTSDIAIGRRTGKSAIHAYEAMQPRWKFLGILTFIVPVLIMTYYAVIGGWFTRYAVLYVTGQSDVASATGSFALFREDPIESAIYSAVFMIVTGLIVFFGVQGGIEKVSKWVMPVLLVLVLCISVYSLTLSNTDADGITRTGLQGLLYFLTPRTDDLTVESFLKMLLDAMSQLFFSLSVSMGIMITYGSYVKKDVNLNKSINYIEIFDTSVALLCTIMIVPSVFVFSGADGMTIGTGLMFTTLPQVFDAMGVAGPIIAALFFISAIFATLTSCISVLESIVANCMEIFHSSRKKTVIILSLIYLAASVVITFGYNLIPFSCSLPTGDGAVLLDVVDYISNNVLMPFVALLSSVLIGWVVGPKFITDEMEVNGNKFSRKKLFVFMIKYVTPVLMLILFIQSTGVLQLFM